MRRPACIVRHSVVQIHSSLLALTLCSLVITTLVYNVTEYFLHVVIAQYMCHIYLASVPWNEVKRFLIVVLTTVTRYFASAHCWFCIWKQCNLHLSFESALFCIASINYACEWYSNVMDGFLFCSEWELRVWFPPDRKSLTPSFCMANWCVIFGRTWILKWSIRRVSEREESDISLICDVVIWHKQNTEFAFRLID